MKNNSGMQKRRLADKIADYKKRVQEKSIPLKELTFNVTLSKAPAEYVKTIPQHIRAAKQLETTRR